MLKSGCAVVLKHEESDRIDLVADETVQLASDWHGKLQHLSVPDAWLSDQALVVELPLCLNHVYRLSIVHMQHPAPLQHI